MNYVEALQKRYSVKKFDKEKKIPEHLLQNILEAGKLSVSSLGLQPYTIYVISSQEILSQLIPAFYNPSQISTCSHLIALVTNTSYDKEYIDRYFHHIQHTRNLPSENLEAFRKNIELNINSRDALSIAEWNDKQAYIVLGNLIFAAALDHIDTCPMEGFNANLIQNVLNLDPEKEKVSVTLALGYRATDDPFQKLEKVRKPNEKLYKFL